MQQEESERLLGPIRICCGTEAEEPFSLVQTGIHLQAGLSIDVIVPQLQQDGLELRWAPLTPAVGQKLESPVSLAQRGTFSLQVSVQME